MLLLAVLLRRRAAGGDGKYPVMPSGQIVLDVKWMPIEPVVGIVVYGVLLRIAHQTDVEKVALPAGAY